MGRFSTIQGTRGHLRDNDVSILLPVSAVWLRRDIFSFQRRPQSSSDTRRFLRAPHGDSLYSSVPTEFTTERQVTNKRPCFIVGANRNFFHPSTCQRVCTQHGVMWGETLASRGDSKLAGYRVNPPIPGERSRFSHTLSH